ncbi:hypothetical protein ACQ4PT_003750 [Festuca glaucescens]
MSSTADLPSWMMLGRFVFRRDDDDGSFPDDDAAPMRTSSFTSLGEPFTVALLPAAPPAVSRLYVRCPPVPQRAESYEILTAHRDLFLLRVTSSIMVEYVPYRQDYFVFKAATAAGVNSRLKRIPACTLPIVHRRRGGKQTTMDRSFHKDTIGLVCRGSGGDGDEFAVVQLAKFVDIQGSSQKTGAEISVFDPDQLLCRTGAELCVFRSHLSSSSSQSSEGDDDVVAEGNWEILMLPIKYREEEYSDLQGFSTDGAITLNDSICWFDYLRGGFMSYTPPPLGPAPTGGGESFISYVRLPIDKRPNNRLPSQYPLEKYRSLCVTGQRGNEQLSSSTWPVAMANILARLDSVLGSPSPAILSRQRMVSCGTRMC